MSEADDGDDGSSARQSVSVACVRREVAEAHVRRRAQVAAEGPVLQAVRGAAHLPGDFALADDHGLSPPPLKIDRQGRRDPTGAAGARPRVACEGAWSWLALDRVLER